MKLRERVVEARLRRGLISEQQSGFVARTTHAMFALRVLMEVRKSFTVVFLNLENACVRVPRIGNIDIA